MNYGLWYYFERYFFLFFFFWRVLFSSSFTDAYKWILIDEVSKIVKINEFSHQKPLYLHNQIQMKNKIFLVSDRIKINSDRFNLLNKNEGQLI